MKLTTKGRFAVTAMLDLALNEASNPVTLSEISDRQSISLSYLEQLFSRMRRVGLVKSIRGPGGGYHTAMDYDAITIKKIITSVDEQIDSTQCGGRENCKDGDRCITHDLWASLNNKIFDYLDGLTLANLVESQHNKKKTIKFDFKKKQAQSLKTRLI
ncbi:MAG: Rrf2 family transcriptional regulator [Methylophilaceae bacterium]|jgi:Rrf2 family transcriptional regulator, iron-sulfur cluster assembly transcription factor|nr:Rrf2 family transcriptional regulator [Methylophilaceae bacterium]